MAKSSALESNFSLMETSKQINESKFLFSKPLNHFRTLAVFFHWSIFVLVIMEALMSSRMCLLIAPISDFDGFIRRHVGWLWKLGL